MGKNIILMKKQHINFRGIVAINEAPQVPNPGKMLHWNELVKYNGSLSMAAYEKIVLTHSAN